MKSDRVFLIVAIVVIVGILFVWWITIREGQRILSPDNSRDVVYASSSTKTNGVITSHNSLC